MGIIEKIKHTCGHITNDILYNKNRDYAGGEINYLASQPCENCIKEKRMADDMRLNKYRFTVSKIRRPKFRDIITKKIACKIRKTEGKIDGYDRRISYSEELTSLYNEKINEIKKTIHNMNGKIYCIDEDSVRYECEHHLFVVYFC